MTGPELGLAMHEVIKLAIGVTVAVHMALTVFYLARKGVNEASL